MHENAQFVLRYIHCFRILRAICAHGVSSALIALHPAHTPDRTLREHFVYTQAVRFSVHKVQLIVQAVQSSVHCMVQPRKPGAHWGPITSPRLCQRRPAAGVEPLRVLRCSESVTSLGEAVTRGGCLRLGGPWRVPPRRCRPDGGGPGRAEGRVIVGIGPAGGRASGRCGAGPRWLGSAVPVARINGDSDER